MEDSLFILFTIISVFCLLWNTSGFLVFYLNKNRKKSVAIIPNLIMFCFLFHAILNFSILINYNYKGFFNNNQLPYILEQSKIYFFIDRNFIKYVQLFNLYVQPMTYCIALVLEMCYCIESIVFFRNPIGSTVKRNIFYVLITVFISIIHFFILLGDLRDFNQLDETQYFMKSIKNLSSYFLNLISFIFIVIALFSLPLIHLSIKTQAVFFIDEKKDFKGRHIFYVIMTCALEIEILIFSLYIRDYVNKLSTESVAFDMFLQCLNLFGLIGGFTRILEINLLLFFINLKDDIVNDALNPFKDIVVNDEKTDDEKTDDSSNSYGYSDDQEIEVSENKKNNNKDEYNLPFINENMSKKIIDFEAKALHQVSRHKKSKKTLKPLTIKIMQNFICETVYYVVTCILASCDEFSGFRQVKDSDYIDLKEHTLQVIDKKLTHHSKLSIENKKIGLLSRFFKGLTSTNVEIIEYAPTIFHNILELNGIDQEKLKQSFDLDKNADYFLDFQNSEGKSGSVFFFTYDKKFIIKTISSTELDAMLNNLLENYYKLIVTNNNSQLMRIYGLYTMKMGLSRNHLILMENIAPFRKKDILFKFDLKGSLLGRKTKITFKNSKTYKDLDYLELCNKDEKAKIELSSSNISKLELALKDDLTLLENAGLMDYSFFVAIVKDNKLIESNENLNKKRLECPSDPSISYFVGIIDYLTPYDQKKKFEDCMKGLINKKESYSAVNPTLYRKRFRNFLFNKVFNKINDED